MERNGVKIKILYVAIFVADAIENLISSFYLGEKLIVNGNENVFLCHALFIQHNQLGFFVNLYRLH